MTAVSPLKRYGSGYRTKSTVCRYSRTTQGIILPVCRDSKRAGLIIVISEANRWERRNERTSQSIRPIHRSTAMLRREQWQGNGPPKGERPGVLVPRPLLKFCGGRHLLSCGTGLCTLIRTKDSTENYEVGVCMRSPARFVDVHPLFGSWSSIYLRFKHPMGLPPPRDL